MPGNLRIDEGHDGGACFWIMPVKIFHGLDKIEKGDEVFFGRVLEHIIEEVSIDEEVQNYPHGNIEDFFIAYRELAHLGTKGAIDFEKATCEMFKKIFHMKAKFLLI